ncbi:MULTISPECIES: LacI family DNA-binding transcriptional regulator [Shewanella]|uniref:LacI family DNA-binding transcriptional regulator n=1 Tax=Shewanella TaxID=22 RepID=UPI001C654F5A|nr:MULTISPECIES: LacI family DNA-binding transcriptional regulator [Shewanella]QYJ76735.1 LacI family DNA-binding transcriptional regulator [Shewanella sp. FJAT-52076]QYK06651.1 LacI family DNA-binding transcriptional regulator [Shewanella zhangzhouensis]
MATIYDVSFLAGVSLATVSRVVNNTGKVSDKTRQKVHDAMAKLDYRPNTIAQSLASNRSNSVGVLVSQLDGPFYGPMMREVESALRAANKHVIIAAGHSDAAQEKDGVEFLLSRGCDALIVDAEILSNGYLVELCQGKTPVVLINRHVDGIDERCVHLNNLQGGLLASRHVLEKGHKQIAYISGPLFKLDARERLEGHRQALAEQGIAFDENLFYEGDFREEGGYEAMAELLSRGRDFTAVVCANDQMASGAIAQCLERGLRVPEDISFVGFDNIPFPRYISPKLTTVCNPIQDMGRMAAHWVLREVYDQTDVTFCHRFEPELVVRDSVITR